MTNEIRYRLADAVSIYDNGQGYLLIVLGQRGTICRLPYRQMTFDLLQFLESPADIQSIEIRFPAVTRSSLRAAIDKLVSLDVLRVEHAEPRQIRCLLLGCGSIGSHIYRHISMLALEHITLVYHDVVTVDNIYRQDYVRTDIGKKKVDVLKSRASRCLSIDSIDKMITCHSELDELIDREKINLVIQAADVPSTTEVARMINYSCDKKDIAFIVNPGYFGNSVSLPEFYYPNNKYDYISSHLAIKGKPLLHHESGKLSYRLCSTLGSLVAEQVEDYRCHCCPAHYGEKGYFDIYDYAWHTEQVCKEPVPPNLL